MLIQIFEFRFTYRALGLCSKVIMLEDRILNVKNIFLNLGYPDDNIYSTNLKTRTIYQIKIFKFVIEFWKVKLYKANLDIHTLL